MNPETAEWVDGPAFSRWLDEHVREFHPYTELPDNEARRLADSENGAHMNVWTADRILTTLGHSIRELPPEIWTETRRRPTQELRDEAVRRRRAGQTQRAIAGALDVARSTVGRWLREARA